MGINIACFVNELALLSIEGLKVCVTDVGRQCVCFPAAGFPSTFAGWRRKSTPEARDETFHGFGVVRGSLAQITICGRALNSVITVVTG